MKIGARRYSATVVFLVMIFSLVLITSCANSNSPAAVSTTSQKSNNPSLNSSQTVYSLTMAVSGQGSTSPSSGSHDIVKDQSVVISAIPSEGWKFDGWTGDASGNNSPITLVMNGKKGITANFSQILYSLITSANGNGTINANPSSGSYPSGSNVYLSAAPSEGWKFDGWGVDASGNSASTSIFMDKNKTVVANFSKVTYILTINVKGNGTTSPAPGGHSYDSGSTVNLSAIASSGYQFSNWTGDTISNSSSTSFIINSDKNITANFIKPPVSNHLDLNIGTGNHDFSLPVMSQGDTLTFSFTVAGADVYYSVLDPLGNAVFKGNGGTKTSSGYGSVTASTPGVFKLHFSSTGIVTPSVLSVDYTVSYPLR